MIRGETDSCGNSILLDRIPHALRTVDSLAPYVLQAKHADSASTPYSNSFRVADARSADLGIDTIFASSVSGVRYTVSPSVFRCDHLDTAVITVSQLDSMLAGCAVFLIRDCAHNQTTYRVCFPAHKLNTSEVERSHSSPDLRITTKPGAAIFTFGAVAHAGELRIYDVLGREVKTIVLPSGSTTAVTSGSLAAGAYVARLEGRSTKFVILK